MASINSTLDTTEVLNGRDLPSIFRLWEETHNQPGYDPVPVLRRLSEIFEEETDVYVRKDPDPFDERHPSRTDPDCELGRSLKLLFRKDHFMTKLVNDYLRDNFYTRQSIQKSSLDINIAACRLILVIMPGLETSAVFPVEHQQLINRIYGWAEDSIEPLQSYATGLIAAAMEVNDMAATFRDLNARLVPKMLKRLHMLQAISKSQKESDEIALGTLGVVRIDETPTKLETNMPTWMSGSAPSSPPHKLNEQTLTTDGAAKLNSASTNFQVNGIAKFSSSSNLSTLLENDNSRDVTQLNRIKKYYIPIHPATTALSQKLILRYLASLGEYQEILGPVFEHNAIQIIFNYIENIDSRDTCLSFEALKYLASLLCHKKFALEFISRGGLERLLKVPRPSVAATGVSITIYYLAYCEEAMERICAMSKKIVSDLVKYALWLLGRSHDSGKCHATMFFGLSFQFKVILDEFDNQDGLRKLYNVISILPILSPEDYGPFNDDEECAARQLVRHVCVSLKKYMESHLFYKYHHFMRQQGPTSDISLSIFKTAKTNLEQVSEQIRNLQELMPFRTHWQPVDQLQKLGGISLILRIIAYSYEWNNSGRAETVRSALDVLSICCVIPKVYVTFCDRLNLPDNTSSAGINAILGAAVGEIVTDAEVQKAALAVLVHCVCAPLNKSPTISRFGSAKRKIPNRYIEDLIEKVWESVCSNNGIIVLLQLMQIKTPITDADCIRGMACRALAGLARSERVRQIIGKLPLFANGQIQHLMRDPILQEKRSEHVIFQKYALELLERVSGKSKPVNNLDASLANIHKANVVAQTRIQYNEKQLYQLIYEHLESKGMMSSAQMLLKEAGLNAAPMHTRNFHQSPFNFKILPINTRTRMRTKIYDLNYALNAITNDTNQQSMATSAVTSLPNNNNNSTTVSTSSSSLTGGTVGIFNFQGNMTTVESSSNEELSIITPIKIKKLNPNVNNLATTSSSSATSNHVPMNTLSKNSNQQQQQRSLQKQTDIHGELSSTNNNHHHHQRLSDDDSLNSNISLGTIVTEYLTNQHALCNNPMSTCPQFDLFKPHKCPDPKPNRIKGLDSNLTSRLFKSQSGYNTMRLDRRFVHSNFRLWRTIRTPSDEYSEVQFTSCNLLPFSNLVIAGTQAGEAKILNINEGTEEYTVSCHNSSLDDVKSNRNGTLVLTSCAWRSPLSILWSVGKKEFQNKLQFADEFYCEFSNLNQDKILGTKTDAATIYDINTGQKISSFTPTISNQYTRNRATFCPTDELILSDGVLWDVRFKSEIHKFDKLNQTLSGVFHPNGLEIISNTEVWDLRTFHLLQTVPVLDQCLIKFSQQNVIYGIYSNNADERLDLESNFVFDTSFKVLDSYDYSSISTIDVKKHIYDLSVNQYGSYISLVENAPFEALQETYVKVYAVGMKKNEEEEEDEDLETDEEGSDSDESHEDLAVAVNRRRRRRRRRNGRRRNDDDNANEEESEWEDLETAPSSDDDDDDDEDDDNDDDDDGDVDIEAELELDYNSEAEVGDDNNEAEAADADDNNEAETDDNNEPEIVDTENDNGNNNIEDSNSMASSNESMQIE